MKMTVKTDQGLFEIDIEKAIEAQCGRFVMRPLEIRDLKIGDVIRLPDAHDDMWIAIHFDIATQICTTRPLLQARSVGVTYFPFENRCERLDLKSGRWEDATIAQ